VTAGPGPAAPAARSRRYPAAVLVPILVGALAGGGAVLLQGAVRLATGFFLTTLVAYAPPEPVSAHGHPAAIRAGLGSVPHPWLLPLVTAAGMMLAVLLSRLADHQVQGTDAVIGAANSAGLSRLTVRGGAVKLLGTAVTLGSGGSGGTEGPIAQVGASLAAAAARRLRLTEDESRTAVVAGLAAGIGALFRAPLGGALFGAELLRRRGAEWRLLPPALLASLAGFAVYGAILGYRPMFGDLRLGPILRPADLIPLTAVGLLCAVLARLYIGVFHAAGRRLTPFRRRPLATAGIAGALVGTAGVFVPELLGTGYGTVQNELSASILLAAPLWLLAALPVIKIAATSVTLGSGGVGGVFGPAIVIGGTAGALCWRLAADAGLSPGPSALYTGAGIAACLGPAVRAPLAAIVFVPELTGRGLPPVGLVLAVAVAYAATGGRTLFPSQPEVPAGCAPRPRQAPRRLLPAQAARLGRRLPRPARVRYPRDEGYQRNAKLGQVRSAGSGGRERGARSRGGDAMHAVDPESADGIPDLSQLPLDALTAAPGTALERAIRTALIRREASGIVYAGFSNGATRPADPAAPDDESAA
jgi:chloride channel protein, CIC family